MWIASRTHVVNRTRNRRKSGFMAGTEAVLITARACSMPRSRLYFVRRSWHLSEKSLMKLCSLRYVNSKEQKERECGVVCGKAVRKQDQDHFVDREALWNKCVLQNVFRFLRYWIFQLKKIAGTRNSACQLVDSFKRQINLMISVKDDYCSSEQSKYTLRLKKQLVNSFKWKV